MCIKPLLALALSVTFAGPALAESFENLDRLEARLTAALDAGVGQPGGPAQPIDRRMKLAACPTPAEIDPPALGAIAIRCQPLGWRIRVPVKHLAAAGGNGGANGGGYAKSDAPPVVRRGDPVELIAGTADFQVSVEGVAQEDGAPGARIKIKTDPKNPPMFAEVVEAGRVILPGFK